MAAVVDFVRDGGDGVFWDYLRLSSLRAVLVYVRLFLHVRY